MIRAKQAINHILNLNKRKELLVMYDFTLTFKNLKIEKSSDKRIGSSSVSDSVFYQHVNRYYHENSQRQFSYTGKLLENELKEIFNKVSGQLIGANYSKRGKISLRPLAFYFFDKMKAKERNDISSQGIHPIHFHGLVFINRRFANNFQDLIDSGMNTTFSKSLQSVQFRLNDGNEINKWISYATKNYDVPEPLYGMYPWFLSYDNNLDEHIKGIFGF